MKVLNTSRLAALVIAVALVACGDPPTPPQRAGQPTMQVSVPTLTGPGIRRLGLPKSFPGPSYTDLVIGERLSTGQCEFQRHIPLHPGLYIVFTEVDLAHCKAVVAQLDWHAKLDSLVVVRSPLVPTQKRALTR